MRLVGRIAGLCFLLLTSACARSERGFRRAAVRQRRFATPVAGAAGVGMTVEARERAIIAPGPRIQQDQRVRHGDGADHRDERCRRGGQAGTGRRFPTRGLSNGGTDARVEVEILRFYNQFRTASGRARRGGDFRSCSGSAMRPGERAIAVVYTVQSVLPAAVQLANGSNAVIALQGAMEKLVEAILGDAAFISALTSTADRRDQPRRRIPAGRTTGPETSSVSFGAAASIHEPCTSSAAVQPT